LEEASPYVNDHDKEPVNKADIDAYRYMLKQRRGVRRRQGDLHERTSEKQFQEFQSRTPSKKLL
jgi:hypothetical protein